MSRDECNAIEEAQQVDTEGKVIFNTASNREYKSRLFCFIFGREENKRWTLSLYNSLHGTNYTNIDDLEFTTIENVLYLGMKNDLSYVVSDRARPYAVMNINEQQSTYNPNMPLREFMYSARLFDKYVKKNKYNIYGTHTIPLPIPKLVVLYNGKTDKADRVILSLDDAYREGIVRSLADKNRELNRNILEEVAESLLIEAAPDISVRVRMININYGHSEELMKGCKPLEEYAWLISSIRDKSATANLSDAVEQSIREMPDDYEIKSLLTEHIAEVKGMIFEEYDEAELEELFKEEGRQEGRQEGIYDARNDIARNMLRNNEPAGKISKYTGLSKNDLLLLAQGMGLKPV